MPGEDPAVPVPPGGTDDDSGLDPSPAPRDGGPPSDSDRATPSESAEPPAERPSEPQTTRSTGAARDYVIQPGDTFSSIAAEQYGDESKWIDIGQANPTVDPSRLQVGQVIRLPDLTATRRSGSERDPAEDDTTTLPPGAVAYRVKTGDTLSSIAKQYYGDETQWRRIYEANRQKIGPNPNRLKLDMTLAIPPAGRGAE